MFQTDILNMLTRHLLNYLPPPPKKKKFTRSWFACVFLLVFFLRNTGNCWEVHWIKRINWLVLNYLINQRKTFAVHRYDLNLVNIRYDLNFSQLTSWPPPNQAVEFECKQMTCSPAVWDVKVNRPSAAYVYNKEQYHCMNQVQIMLQLKHGFYNALLC